MTPSDPTAPALATLLDEGAQPRDPVAARVAFLQRVEERQATQRHRIPTRPILAGAFVLAAAVLALILRPSAPLSYEVVAASDAAGYVRAATERPAQLRFSDGTELKLAEDGRLRVEGLTAEGATISLESGSLVAQVKHRTDSRWSFRGGPFLVRVTGTSFKLTWDPQRELLVVDLSEGSIEVDAFGRGAPVSVRAGQQVVGDARARSLLVADRAGSLPESPASVAIATPSASAPDTVPASAPSADRGEPPLAGGAPAAPARSSAASRETSTSWTQLVAQTRFAEVVALGEARGVAQCAASCSVADLTALADAARYTGKHRIAEAALLASRQRFGAGNGRASFMLGRLYEGEGRRAEARDWYERSVAEAPLGPFAAEARAGRERVATGPGSSKQR